MEFNLNEDKEVVVLLGAGSMGTAIIKRISTNRIIFLGDISEENLKARAEELRYNGYIVETQIVDALDEKFLTAVQLRDKKSQEEAIVKLYDISDKRLIDSMPLFFMKLLSKDYEGALDLLNEANVQKEDENYVELYKGAIYKHLTDDLNAQLMLDDNIELDVEDAIRIMLEFKENGTDHGQIHGVNYFVL